MPGAWSDANFTLSHLVCLIRTLERECFDAFFMANHLDMLTMPTAALRPSFWTPYKCSRLPPD